MYTRLLLLVVTTFLLFPVNTFAEEEDLAFFDLSLAGYSIGMSYDVAASVRSIHYIRNLKPTYDEKLHYQAEIDNVYVDGVEMNILLVFVEDKLQKIICKFHPDAIEDMIRRFQVAFGTGENKSRVIPDGNGVEIWQSVYRWDFPKAKIFLFGSSANIDFAIVSLVAKRQKSLTSDQAETLDER